VTGRTGTGAVGPGGLERGQVAGLLVEPPDAEFSPTVAFAGFQYTVEPVLDYVDSLFVVHRGIEDRGAEAVGLLYLAGEGSDELIDGPDARTHSPSWAGL